VYEGIAKDLTKKDLLVNKKEWYNDNKINVFLASRAILKPIKLLK
jgi:NAD(P)H-nitrite reductase large subunit